MTYRALGDVPTVDVNPAFLTPPSPTSVTDLQLDPYARVGLPSSTSAAAAVPAQGLSLGTVGAVSALAVGWALLRGRRR